MNNTEYKYIDGKLYPDLESHNQHTEEYYPACKDESMILFNIVTQIIFEKHLKFKLVERKNVTRCDSYFLYVAGNEKIYVQGCNYMNFKGIVTSTTCEKLKIIIEKMRANNMIYSGNILVNNNKKCFDFIDNDMLNFLEKSKKDIKKYWLEKLTTYRRYRYVKICGKVYSFITQKFCPFSVYQYNNKLEYDNEIENKFFIDVLQELVEQGKVITTHNANGEIIYRKALCYEMKKT